MTQRTGEDGTMKCFHQLARQIEVLEMANPNRTVAAARERAALHNLAVNIVRWVIENPT